MTTDQGLWRPGLILLTTLSLVATQVLNVQRCGDPHCNGVVSEGRTLLKYHANSNSMLSFGKNQNVRIFSKGDGTQQDIWGVEIGGKRGFVNKRHVQEHRVMVRNIAYVAPPHASYQEIQLTGPEVTTAPPPVQQPEQVQPQVLPTVPPPVAEPEQPVTSTTAKPELNEAVTAKADDKPELLEPTGESSKVPPSPDPSPPIVPNDQPMDIDQVSKSIETLAGAHATQVNAGPEDMEFNRIKTSYANVQGDFVLESVASEMVSGASSVVSSSMFSSVSAEPLDYEIIDGTKIYNDGRFELVQETLKVDPTKVVEAQMMTDQPEMSDKVPDIQSSVMESASVNEANNDSINVEPTEELKISKSEAPEVQISTTVPASQVQATPEAPKTVMDSTDAQVDEAKDKIQVQASEDPGPVQDVPKAEKEDFANEIPIVEEPPVPQPLVQDHVKESGQEPLHEPVEELVHEPAKAEPEVQEPEPVQEPVQEPEPVQELVQEPIQEPVQEPHKAEPQVQETLEEPVQHPVQPPVPQEHHVQDPYVQEPPIEDPYGQEGHNHVQDQHLEQEPSEEINVEEEEEEEEHEDYDDDIDETDDQEKEDKTKAFVQDLLQEENEIETDVEKNKAFIQEQLQQATNDNEIDATEFQVTEAPLEVNVSEEPTEEVTTESPGLFGSFFGGSEPEVPEVVPEVPMVPQSDPEVPGTPEIPQEVPVVPEVPQEQAEVQVPQDEIRFFEPGQAPEYHPEQNTETTQSSVDPIEQQEEQVPEEQVEPEVPVKVLEMPPEIPPEPEISTEIPIQEENPQLPIENEFQYQDQPLAPQEPIETQTEETVTPEEPEHVPFHLREEVEHQEIQTEPLENDGVLDETIVHYIEFFGPFVPEWLHKSFHWNSVFGMSPTMVLFVILSLILIGSIVFVNFINIVVAKFTDNSHIKMRCAELDKALFKAKNELLAIQRDSSESSRPQVSETQIKEVIREIPSKAHLLELENLKRDKSELLKQNSAFHVELEQSRSEKSGFENRIFGLTEELSLVKNQLDQAQQELSEAESVVAECVEEKKKLNNVNNTELVQAIDTLRDQLNSQKEAVLKYEGKIKRRDSELKEKTQELRKLRAEAANAKLQVDKVASERDNFKSKIEALEAMETELTDRNSEMQVQLSVLESVQSDLKCANEKLDDKEAELEAVTNEIAVLKETINSLKLVSNGGQKMTKSSDNGFESGDGWDVEDEVEIPDSETAEAAEAISEVDFEAICDTARLKVDLQKAQAACETLTEQLMSAEAAKETFEAEAKNCKIEAENARKAKETAMEERCDLAKKHEVLSSYFNQREAELQKQLGVQTQRLGEVSEDSESVSKKLNLLYDELESYKEQCKSLKQEMEEQERSLKAQNAALEKKQHESWVTVRQETRKLTDAQNEMQTLRTRLTLAETKLAEKTVEIDKINEENRAMKETMDRINNHQIVKPDPMYLNGGHDLPSLTSSGPGSITEELPPDLPLLPPMMPLMQTAPPPMMYPADNRPAPLGRRSPPHGGRGGRYSRSPSPTYGENRRSNYHRDVSPTPSDRSDRSSRYASSSYEYDEGRYSPPYPPRHRRRQSRDDRSPDRYSSRSERSDYEREYRNTPPRDNNRRRSSRDEDFPGSGRDFAQDYSRRDKRSDRVKERHGPKTSSPML